MTRDLPSTVKYTVKSPEIESYCNCDDASVCVCVRSRSVPAESLEIYALRVQKGDGGDEGGDQRDGGSGE